MKIIADTHTHTIVSGDAHSTLLENLRAAKEQGLKICNGLPMLIYQAIFALEYFLDRPLDHERMAEVIKTVL